MNMDREEDSRNCRFSGSPWPPQSVIGIGGVTIMAAVEKCLEGSKTWGCKKVTMDCQTPICPVQVHSVNECLILLGKTYRSIQD